MADKEKLLVCALSDFRVGFELTMIDRIVRAVEISFLPDAPAIVMGLVNVHGYILPVLNIRRLFDLPDVEVCLDDLLIITRTANHRVAVVVDGVFGVAEYRMEDVVPQDALFTGIRYLEGVVKLADGLIYIYNFEKLLLPESAVRLGPLTAEPSKATGGEH